MEGVNEAEKTVLVKEGPAAERLAAAALDAVSQRHQDDGDPLHEVQIAASGRDLCRCLRVHHASPFANSSRI